MVPVRVLRIGQRDVLGLVPLRKPGFRNLRLARSEGCESVVVGSGGHYTSVYGRKGGCGAKGYVLDTVGGGGDGNYSPEGAREMFARH